MPAKAEPHLPAFRFPVPAVRHPPWKPRETTGNAPPIAAAILSAAAPMSRTCLTRGIIASTQRGIRCAFILAAKNNDDVAIERLDGLDRGIHIRGLGVIEESHSVHCRDELNAMFHTAKIPIVSDIASRGNTVAVRRLSLPQEHCRYCVRRAG